MTNENTLVLEIWELVRDQLPAARRLETAAGILRAFEEYGFDKRDLDEIVEEDAYLAKAFHEVFDVDQDEEDDYSDEDE
jgi:hypothetical protein